MVCGALISSDSLEWERTQLWALTFKLVRKIIGGVDYKVCDMHTHKQAQMRTSIIRIRNGFRKRGTVDLENY